MLVEDALRVFELTTHVKSISRGDGRSATAAAAYRACCEISCEREGRTHDYTRKAGLEASEIVAPADAPAWTVDRSKLWNAAEMRERNGARGKRANEFKQDARPARELLFTFPAELSKSGRLNVARAIARHLAETHGVAADFSIHQPGRDGDERNHHCHLMWTARRMTAKGLGEKTREWDDLKKGAALTKKLREFVAATLNQELTAERKAEQVHVEHRTFKARGEPLKATRHQGPTATHLLRKQQMRDRKSWAHEQRANLSRQQTAERASLKGRQDFNMRLRMDALDRQQASRIAAIRERLAAEQAADRAPTGLSRAFQKLTGQAARFDFARAERMAGREMAAERETAEVRREVQAERNAFERDQKRERDDQETTHRQQNAQLQEAYKARIRADRVDEQQARLAEVGRGIGQEQARGFERDGPGMSPTFH